MSVHFSKEPKQQESNPLPHVLQTCLRELDEYFKGERTKFSVQLEREGTSFQQQVWNEVHEIPYGTTASYKQVAVSLGKVDAVRAVGNANGKNRLAILIPCHRVIGSSGNLHGYAWDVWRKKWLLAHEKNTAERLGKQL